MKKMQGAKRRDTLSKERVHRDALQDAERSLRRAFLTEPLEIIPRNEPLLLLGNAGSGAFLIRQGVAYRSFELPDDRRAILDLLISGDIVGLENAMVRHPHQSVLSTGHVSGHRLGATAIRELMADPAIDRVVLRRILDAAARMDRLTILLTKLDARERIAAMVLDLHDRLRRRRLIRRISFNLSLTQEEIGNYLGLTLAHVNRTLRRMREDHLMIFDRGTITFLDIERLRDLVRSQLATSDYGHRVEGLAADG